MELVFPVIFLLPIHLGSEELHELKEKISTLTYNATEAEIFLGKITQKKRALTELRHLKVNTEEVVAVEQVHLDSAPPAKRRKIWSPHKEVLGDDLATISDTASGTAFDGEVGSTADHRESAAWNTVKVVKLAWLTDSLKEGVVLPLDDYVIYEGCKLSISSTAAKAVALTTPPSAADDILRRAQTDIGITSDLSSQTRLTLTNLGRGRNHQLKRPPLLTETTSEDVAEHSLPPVPDYLHTMYACQRPSPKHPPNEMFVEELEKIRTFRTLLGDQIGVRAYSTAISSLRAYPYTLTTPPEVARLPGCGSKIALLFREYKESGGLREARSGELDSKLAVLNRFYNIWGVGEVTAQEFYNKGWRDLDDVVEYGWSTLNRVQQIGVKYYDEFLLKIPRAEVEAISNTILTFANRILEGFQMLIVGGYRRGKEGCGDVDIVISHPDEAATNGLIVKLADALEDAGYVTHTLTLSTRNSERGQWPVQWKSNGQSGSGFDTLDKALVVWQDTAWTGGEAKNPNPHRRVDIIISPWKTVGCAVLGWSGGTTFERDLRRYCKAERSLKFDSSGVRSRVDGSWVDLESDTRGNPAPDMLTAERRVFKALGLEYRSPVERCTG